MHNVPQINRYSPGDSSRVLGVGKRITAKLSPKDTDAKTYVANRKTADIINQENERAGKLAAKDNTESDLSPEKGLVLTERPIGFYKNNELQERGKQYQSLEYNPDTGKPKKLVATGSTGSVDDWHFPSENVGDTQVPHDSYVKWDDQGNLLKAQEVRGNEFFTIQRDKDGNGIYKEGNDYNPAPAGNNYIPGDNISEVA